MTKHKRRKVGPQRAVSKPANGIQTASKPAQKIEPTIPFDAEEDRILLVGEGDFSFAKSIVEHHGCYYVTATCLDTKEELFQKYESQGRENVSFLEDEGQTVLYGIDATKLDSMKAVKKCGTFDEIMFNFPHVGGKSKDVNRQVRFNQELLVKFFSAATSLLVPAGKIIVTLFEGEPYTLWNVKDLARHSGLEVQRTFKFMPEAYPGYAHSRTLGNIEGGGGWKGEDRDARSYIFRRRGEKQAPGAHGTKKRKRKSNNVSSDEDG